MILLTGATGYIGGRLRRILEDRRLPVRCLSRRPESLQTRVADSTETVEGDLLDFDSLPPALDGVQSAYYLVHSMGSEKDFADQDRKAAENFSRAARDAGVEKVIYLGGLGRGEDLSPHLASRQEVGRILRESGVPTVELRASIIIGSGSLSFEMIRSLVDKLPVMITPSWVRIQAQPISIEDVLEYLVESLALPVDASRLYEIGGSSRVSYGGLMREYARQRGLRRIILPVPLLSLRLSSLWLGLVTPIYARTGKQLIDSVRNETIVTDDRALRDFRVRPRNHVDAVARALSNEDREFAETRWSDALSSVGETSSYGGVQFRRRLVDSRSQKVSCSASAAFAPIQKIGGEQGWYYGNWLWSLRGFLDLLAGGAGVRRGRRHPLDLAVGDTIDFWRVESYEPGRILRLRAEMKVPGRAWLQFEVVDREEGAEIHQTAIFDPRGLSGLLYWYALYPVHQFVFTGMLVRIARQAERAAGEDGSSAQL